MSGTRPVTVVIVRGKPGTCFGIALATTGRTATAEQLTGGYASRWSIEIAIEDSRQTSGAGQARNRTAAAAGRTVPFEPACQPVAVTWYATAGHDPAGLHERRTLSPWHASKAEPATAGMAARLRRVIITARFKAPRPGQLRAAEISLPRLAREAVTSLAVRGRAGIRPGAMR